MRNLFSIFLLLSVSLVVAPSRGNGEELIHVLTTEGQSFTNVVVEQVTDTHLFFRHRGGISSVKLMDLSPELQKQLDYNPVRGAQLLNDQALADAAYESRVAESATAASTNIATANTNVLKSGYGLILRDFHMGKAGVLSLSFPNVWMYDAQQSADPTAPGLNIRFGPQYGTNFMVIVSTLSPSNALVRAGALRMMTLVAGDRESHAVEKPVIKRLDGTETSGYYFSFADKTYGTKERKSAAFRFQEQGMVNIDDFALYFTVLYNYPESSEDKATLEMIRSAHFSREDSAR